MRISTQDLVPGMYVAELDRPWEETPFLFQGFVVETLEDVETVRRYCQHVIIDQQKVVRLDRQPRKHKHKRRRISSRTAPPPLAERLPRALDHYHHSSRVIGDIMDDVRLGKAIDTPAAKEAVAECVEEVMQSPDTALLLSRIRHKDEYTSQHSLSVSLLSIALGRSLGMSREQLNEVGLCGLLHDVGKVLTPDEVLKKPGRLTVEEMEIMKQHPVDGRNILLSTDGVTRVALDVAHAHHERLNGTGYPRGLKAGQITPYTKIVAIADTYDAITSDRVYDTGRPPTEAFNILWRGIGKQWDTRMVAHFIKTIGLYAPGTIVELTTRELAVVIAPNRDRRLAPQVLVLPAPGEPIESARLLDLAEQQVRNSDHPIHIQRMRTTADTGVDLQALVEQGLLDNVIHQP